MLRIKFSNTSTTAMQAESRVDLNSSAAQPYCDGGFELRSREGGNKVNDIPDSCHNLKSSSGKLGTLKLGHIRLHAV